MWRSKLHKVYNNFKEFEYYCDIYNNHIRLGYNTPKEAWKENPLIEGSVNPNDYKKIK